MKKQLLFLFCILLFSNSFSQIFEVEAIKNEGDDDKRINLVIMGDGYTVGELAQFETDANNFVSAMFSQSPFAEYSDYFNVYIINVISNESGANHPGTATDEASYDVPVSVVDNFFGSTYDGFDSHRLLYTPNDALVMSVLADNFPQYDQALILVNAPYYGGSGGEFPVASTGDDADEIAIHEIGHSLVDLKDEYYPGDFFAEEGINMTQQTNPALVKWTNWIGSNGIGIYQYCASGTDDCAIWNRPHQTCKMRYLGFDFCSVCKEGIIEKVHDLVSPIDSYTPISSSVENPTFPLSFELDLVEPLPNTLETTWTINTVEFDTNVNTISVLEANLNEGNNNVTVVVNDASSLQRINNHDSFHVYTVSWTIDNTLGIETLTSEVNNLNISLYPNPTNSIVNVKIKSTLATQLTADIVSIDGEKVNTINLSNAEISQIDISTLQTGIYILKFYSNGILIGNKKLIKK